MKQTTKDQIIIVSKRLFSLRGYEGFSIRTVSQESGIGISSIYHFFSDKDAILTEIFAKASISLGKKRELREQQDTASEMLKDRIIFQFENIVDVIFILKYYLHFKSDFKQNEHGYIPEKAYLHISEVLIRGIESGEFQVRPEEIHENSKVIAHAINGFLLEYYPTIPSPSELQAITNSLHSFILNSLTKKEDILMGAQI